jgi:hydroxymethylpyrimidine/phosphomethylpyrimidine kinase
VTNLERRPIALTIAGSDSGGGAGIQADLKTFAALGIHGTSAITCITAQNPTAVLAIQPVRAGIVQKQIEAVFAELKPAAVKTGMLFSVDIIRVVVDFFSGRNRPPLVVDPVMVATSGAVLLKQSAIRVLRKELLPRATLITPNLDETALLLGRMLTTRRDLEPAARELYERFGCAVLVKGGHLRDRGEAVDILFDGRESREFVAPRVAGVSTHGTGCTYSAAITAGLARGLELAGAVALAKEHITAAIRHSYRVARHTALNHSYSRRSPARKII